jgi:hypothetical protein
MALRPVFVVGVGGSGVRTLMALQSVLLRRLRALPGGWSGSELPDGWQLLAIDAESNQPADFKAPTLQKSSFHALMASHGEDRRYPELLRDLLRRDPVANVETFGGWLRPPHDRQLSDGAGQLRAIGRAVSAYGLSELNRVVDAAHERMTSIDARGQLERIATAMGTTVNHEQPVPILVSSVAGGTGSGMFLDVLEVMRSVKADLSRNAQVLLYGADVFKEAERRDYARQVDANALAAISEIVTGVWGRSVTPGTVQLYNRSGIGEAVRAVEDGGNAFGARYHYLIGARNLGGSELATDDRAYWAVADALGAIVADPSVSGRFRRYFITNVFDNSYSAEVAGDTSGLTVPNDAKYLNPFASIGAGRLSVGSDRLVEYAVQALTRSTIERLLWPAFAAEGEDTDVEDRVARAWPEFLAGTGLDERDVEQDGAMVRHDEVIEALRTGAQAERLERAVQAILREASAGAETTGLTGEEWTSRLIGAFDRQRDGIEDAIRDGVDDAARAYLPYAERRLLLAVSDAAGRYGIPVALGLLRRLEDELRFTALEQLPVQATGGRRQLDTLPGLLERIFGTLGEERVGTGHRVVEVARGTIAKLLDGRLDRSERCRAAAAILDAFRTDVVPAIATALQESATRLAKDIEGGKATDRTQMPYAAFPRLREPATGEDRIGPSEVLLEPVGRFADLVDRAARETVGADLADQWDRALVRRTIVGGSLDGTSEGAGLLDVEQGWTPRGRPLQPDGSEPMRPRYRGPRTVLEVADRSEDLLRDRTTPLGRLAARTLREYLDVTDGIERAEREQRFVDGFVEVMRRSVPFVEIDTRLAAEVHPAARLTRTSVIVSALPVRPDAPLAKRLRTALEEAGRWDGAIEDAFGDVDAPTVDVFQSLASSVGPLVLPTIMRPAWERWLTVRDDPARAAAFWDSKRARPLLETLPIARPQLERLVVGWYAGLLIEHVRRSVAGRAGLHVEVRDDERGVWVSAPFPLLDRDAGEAAALPAVLASLPLALAESGYAGSLDPLRPYRLLIELGTRIGRSNDPLAAVLADGEAAEGRRASMLAVLDTEKQHVEDEVARVDGHEPVTDRIWRSSLTYELADLLLAGIAVVREALGSDDA